VYGSEATDATELILQLIKQLGMVEFGFVAQALIGLVFQRLGAKEMTIKHNGHPDLKFRYLGEKWRMEVEVIGKNHVDHTVKSEDLEATRPRRSNEVGCICLLDVNPPCRWYMVRSPSVWESGEKGYALFELRNVSDQSLSEHCTGIFNDLVLLHEDSILKKGYSGLAQIIKNGHNQWP
jgi:hypothetical protein